MKIFGFTFTTKKELREANAILAAELESCEDELAYVEETFPFDMGQVVYDIALKNAQGKYTKTKPSLDHCTITEVVVDEKNYFKLVDRYRRNDVFMDRDEAEEYLRSICK